PLSHDRKAPRRSSPAESPRNSRPRTPVNPAETSGESLARRVLCPFPSHRLREPWNRLAQPSRRERAPLVKPETSQQSPQTSRRRRLLRVGRHFPVAVSLQPFCARRYPHTQHTNEPRVLWRRERGCTEPETNDNCHRPCAAAIHSRRPTP